MKGRRESSGEARKAVGPFLVDDPEHGAAGLEVEASEAGESGGDGVWVRPEKFRAVGPVVGEAEDELVGRQYDVEGAAVVGDVEPGREPYDNVDEVIRKAGAADGRLEAGAREAFVKLEGDEVEVAPGRFPKIIASNGRSLGTWLREARRRCARRRGSPRVAARARGVGG